MRISSFALVYCDKDHDQRSLGRKVFLSAHSYSPSWRQVKARTKGRNLARTYAEAIEECCLQAWSCWLVFLCTPGPLALGGTTHSVLVLSISIINQENSPYNPIKWTHFLNYDFLFTVNYSLCPVVRKLASIKITIVFI